MVEGKNDDKKEERRCKILKPFRSPAGDVYRRPLNLQTSLSKKKAERTPDEELQNYRKLSEPKTETHRFHPNSKIPISKASMKSCKRRRKFYAKDDDNRKDSIHPVLRDGIDVWVSSKGSEGTGGSAGGDFDDIITRLDPIEDALMSPYIDFSNSSLLSYNTLP
ncbi:hypothetical protein LguiB_023211 [Lonicera macranthoides]